MEVLIIDDEKSIRETLGPFLQEQGHRVRLASSGEEGLWLLEEQPAELVITDLKMPGLSGIEVLGRVRERWPGVEVVLVTGYGTMDDAVAALRLGAYDFLIKPVRLARLELLIRHCEERLATVEETLLVKLAFPHMNKHLGRIFSGAASSSPYSVGLLRFAMKYGLKDEDPQQLAIH